MFYLHQIFTPRDTIIEISENPISAPGHLELNGHPLIYEDGGIVQNRAGWTLGPITSDTEAYTLATIIATHYNNDVMADGELIRLPFLPDSAGVMAAALGRRGGRSTSAAKADAARENGRKGGRHLASYYIRIDSYWQNSGDYFVGPFADRDEAQAEIDRSVSDPQSLTMLAGRMAKDVKNGIRIHGVLSKTEAKRFGLREIPSPDGWNLVGKRIPTTAYEMWRT